MPKKTRLIFKDIIPAQFSKNRDIILFERIFSKSIFCAGTPNYYTTVKGFQIVNRMHRAMITSTNSSDQLNVSCWCSQKEIIGIKVGNEEIKLNIFANDLTTFVKNTRSFFSLKQVINNFGYISGLKLNEEKTEVYWLGSLHNSPEDLGIDNVNKPMKILGIFFTYDWQKFQELNFEKIITSIKKNP